jgi:acyl carrier protein
MSDCDIQDLIAVFDEVVDLTGIEVRADAVLGTDIPIDSRDMLRALSRMEARFHVRFTPQDTLTMRTVGDVVAAVNRRLASG